MNDIMIQIGIPILVVVYGVAVVIIGAVTLSEFTVNSDGLYSMTPYIISVHRESKMNWFGCLLYTLFVYFINPLWMIPRFFVVIIYFLAHVGRKKDE